MEFCFHTLNSMVLRHRGNFSCTSRSSVVKWNEGNRTISVLVWMAKTVCRRKGWNQRLGTYRRLKRAHRLLWRSGGGALSCHSRLESRGRGDSVRRLCSSSYWGPLFCSVSRASVSFAPVFTGNWIAFVICFVLSACVCVCIIGTWILHLYMFTDVILLRSNILYCTSSYISGTYVCLL